MTSPLLLINRLVPAVVAALAVLVGGWQLTALLPSQAETAPLIVADIVLPAIPTHAVRLPERNLFAADGVAWVLPNEQPAGPTAVATAGSGKVLGVVKLPGGPKGVMVDKRFVAIGEALGGGRLKDVRAGQYIVEIDGIEQVRPLDTDRKGRAETLLKKRERE